MPVRVVNCDVDFLERLKRAEERDSNRVQVAADSRQCKAKHAESEPGQSRDHLARVRPVHRSPSALRSTAQTRNGRATHSPDECFKAPSTPDVLSGEHPPLRLSAYHLPRLGLDLCGSQSARLREVGVHGSHVLNEAQFEVDHEASVLDALGAYRRGLPRTEGGGTGLRLGDFW